MIPFRSGIREIVNCSHPLRGRAGVEEKEFDDLSRQRHVPILSRCLKLRPYRAARHSQGAMKLPDHIPRYALLRAPAWAKVGPLPDRYLISRFVEVAPFSLNPHESLGKRNRVFWSGRPDLNQRPSAPKADALPGCATPRWPEPKDSAAGAQGLGSPAALARTGLVECLTRGPVHVDGAKPGRSIFSPSARCVSTSSHSPMTTTPAPSLSRTGPGVAEPCGPTATSTPASFRTAAANCCAPRSSGGGQRQNR